MPTGGAEHTLPPPAPERGDSSRGTSYRGSTGVTGGEEDARCVLWENRHRDTVLPGESPTARPGCTVSGGRSHTRSPQPQSIPSSGAHPSTGASLAHGTAAQSIPGPPATAPPQSIPSPPRQSSCGRSRPVTPVRSRLTRTLRPAAAAVSLAHACRRSEPGRFSRAGRRRGGGVCVGPLGAAPRSFPSRTTRRRLHFASCSAERGSDRHERSGAPAEPCQDSTAAVFLHRGSAGAGETNLCSRAAGTPGTP